MGVQIPPLAPLLIQKVRSTEKVKCRVEDLSAVRKKIYVEIPRGVVAEETENAYRALNKKVRIKGFRPGKVPREILERYYRQNVEIDVLDKLLNDSYPKAVQEARLSPVARPVIDEEEFKPGEDLKYTATVEVKPVIEVKDYLELEIEKKEVPVTDQDVEKKLVEIRQMNAHFKSIDEDRPIREGDVAVIDYKGFLDGNPVEGSNGQSYYLEVGSGLFNPDFEGQLIGLSKNAETEIKVTFSEDFANKTMAGKTMDFQVAVNDIKEKVVPVLDDAFAVDLGADFKNLEDLRNKVKETLVEARKKQAEADMRNQVIDLLIAKCDFELPESLLEEEIDAMVDESRRKLARMGIPVESTGISDKDLRDKFREEAGKRARGSLILEEIARRENLRVEEKDIDEEFAKVARTLNMRQEEAKHLRANPNLMQSLPDYILPQKTLDYLMEHAKIK
ncbi:MAG TPA: trigger factor [Proteobacteria bacterium]|nr:trigger factor [Pseudomonadota bacterium]